MSAKLGAEEDVGEGTIGCDLNEMVAEGAERSDKVRMVLVKFVVFGDVHQEVTFDVLVLWGPNLLTAFIDNLILVWVMIGGGARRGSEEVREELGFWEDGEREDVVGRSRWGWGRDSSNGGSDNGRRKVFNWDVSKQDTFNNFFETLVDICILRLGVRILKLRTRKVVLLGGDISEYLEEIGRGGNEDGGGQSDGDDGWQVNNKWGKEGGWCHGRSLHHLTFQQNHKQVLTSPP